MLRIYNTLTRNKEQFVPLNDGVVKMYACGITVNGKAHIGHAVQAVIFDIIRKYLEKSGYKVTYARNFTDVDDKIIAQANACNMDAMEFAKMNMEAITKSLHELGVTDATLTLNATDNIDNIIEFVSKLIDKGVAYATVDGDVYFAVDKYLEYGKLSNRNLEDAISGVRIDTMENKRNPLDFALWKAAKPGEIYWESPWGNGRPGWHIECSAMNLYHLGEQIDIHGGGRDLIFPHHENEIAQTEALTGKQFAKYWIHNGLVKVNGQKMSKSLGNGIMLDDLLAKYDSEVVRFGLIQGNYKNDLNITDNLFDEVENHLYDFYVALDKVNKLGVENDNVNPKIDEEFNVAMDDDFNTALAIANLFGYFKTINKKLEAKDNSCVEDRNAIVKTYSLFGILQHNPAEFIEKINQKRNGDIPEIVKQKAEERWVAKQNRDFATADRLRGELTELGYTIKDSKDGYEIQKM